MDNKQKTIHPSSDCPRSTGKTVRNEQPTTSPHSQAKAILIGAKRKRKKAPIVVWKEGREEEYR